MFWFMYKHLMCCLTEEWTANSFSVVVLCRLVVAMKILACNYLGFATSLSYKYFDDPESEWALHVGAFIMFILACWWYKGYYNLQKYNVAAFILFMVIGTREICKVHQSWNMYFREPQKCSHDLTVKTKIYHIILR